MLNIIGILNQFKHMVPSEIILTICNGADLTTYNLWSQVLGIQPGKNLKIAEESHAYYMFEWLPLSQRAPLQEVNCS